MTKFDAFISYSHAADGRLAPELQSGLQRLAKGVFQRRALRVFRDETGLSTNPHLWGSIESALDESSWFVLLASPQAARSDWVAREVSTWLASHPLDHILTVVTDGEIGFLPGAGVDRVATTCLPAPLIDALDNEPRWLDLRWARTDTQLDLRNGRFRAAVADLAAPIHGVDKEDLEGEDVRQQKRARRLAVGGIAAIALLAVASLIAALLAVDRTNEARDQRNVATEQRNVATAKGAEAEAQRKQADVERAKAEASANVALSRGLAAQAAYLSPADIDLGLLLGVEGYRRDPSIDTKTGLLAALDNARGITQLVRTLPTGVIDIEISPDRSTLYAATGAGDVWAVDTSTWTEIGKPLVAGLEGITSVDVSLDGRRLAVSTSKGVTVLDLATSTVLATALGAEAPASMALNDDGTLICLGSLNSRVTRVFDVDTEEQVFEVEGNTAAEVFLSERRLAVQDLGSSRLAVYSLDGDPTVPVAVRDDLPPGGGLVTSPDGTVLIAGGLAARAVLLDSSTLEPLGPEIEVRGSRTGDFFFNPDGTLVGMGSDDGSARVFDVATSTQVFELTGATGALWSEFTGPTSIISVSFYDNAAVVWDIDRVTQIGDARHAGEYVAELRSIEGGAKVVLSMGGDVVVADSADVSREKVRRTVGSASRAISVAEDAGLVAVYSLTIDEAAQKVTARTAHVLHLADLTEQVTIEFGESPVENVALSNDGTRLAVGFRQGTLAVYDATTGRVLLEPVQLDEYPCCLGMLVWNNDDTRLHVGGQDGTLRTLDTTSWEIVSEQVLAADQTALRLGKLSADGTQVIVPTEAGAVYLVDADSGSIIGEPFLASGTQFQVATVAAAGTMLVAESRDGKLRMWDIATRRAIGPAMGGHIDWSQSLDLLADDVAMSGGGIDGKAITWTLNPQAWADRACEVAGRNLTRSEWDTYVGGEYQATCAQWPENA